MTLFLIELNDQSVKMVVRGAGKSCARAVAVDNAGTEGTAVWRDPELSTVKVIQPDSPVRGLVLRHEA